MSGMLSSKAATALRPVTSDANTDSCESGTPKKGVRLMLVLDHAEVLHGSSAK
jgi:hypothetical protein